MCVIMTQHPVGQGGLFYGALAHEAGLHKWMYDCGSKDKDELHREIGEVARRSNGTIDELYLSHFHEDHYKGFDYLTRTKGVKVEDVIVPYLDDYEKIATLAIHQMEGIDISEEIREFIMTPEKFFFDRGVNRIIMIGDGRDDEIFDSSSTSADPEGPEGPATFDDEKRRDEGRSSGDGKLEKVWEPELVKVSHGFDPEKKQFKASSTVVRELRLSISGVPVPVYKLAFVPHVRSMLADEMSDFINEIESLKRKYKVNNVKDIIGKKNWLNEVVRCFISVWPSGKQNTISMSLYIGPQKRYSWFDLQRCFYISFSLNRIFHIANRRMYCCFQKFLSLIRGRFPAQWKDSSKFSWCGGWLLTGDSVIVNHGKDKGKNFRDQFEHRYQHYMPYVSVLMVPHHGSDINNVSRDFFDLFGNLEVCYVTANPCKHFKRAHPHERLMKRIPKSTPFHVVDTHPESILEMSDYWTCYWLWRKLHIWRTVAYQL